MPRKKIEIPEKLSEISSSNKESLDKWEDSIVSQILEKRKGKTGVLGRQILKKQKSNADNSDKSDNADPLLKKWELENNTDNADNADNGKETRKGKKPISEKQKTHLEKMRLKATIRNKELKKERDIQKELTKKQKLEDMIAQKANERIERILERIPDIVSSPLSQEKQLLISQTGVLEKRKPKQRLHKEEPLKSLGSLDPDTLKNESLGNPPIKPPWL